MKKEQFLYSIMNRRSVLIKAAVSVLFLIFTLSSGFAAYLRWNEGASPSLGDLSTASNWQVYSGVLSGYQTIFDDPAGGVWSVSGSVPASGDIILIGTSLTLPSYTIGTGIESVILSAGVLTANTPFTIDGSVINTGTLNAAGTITVNGTLINTASASCSAVTLSNTAAGTITNNGTLSITDMSNTGTVTNGGTLAASNTITNSGNITNNGHISTAAGLSNTGSIDTTNGTIAGSVTGTTPTGLNYIWTGNSGSSWNTGDSWNIGTAPPADGTASVQIPDVSTGSNTYPSLTTAINLASLTIDAGASVTLNGQNITCAAFTNNGTVYSNGTGSVSLSGTISETGLWSFSSGTIPIITNHSYNNVEITGTVNGPAAPLSIGGNLTVSGTAVFTSDDTLDVNGLLTVSGSASVNFNSTSGTNQTTTLGSLTLSAGGSISTGNDAGDSFEVKSGDILFPAGSGSVSTGGTITASGSAVNIQIAKDITLTALTTFSQPVALTAAADLTLTGNAVFLNTLTGDNAHGLHITGTARFNDAVTDITNLKVTGTTDIYTTTITTTGTQTYTGNVTLGANAVLTAGSGQNISMGSDLTGGGNTLTISGGYFVLSKATVPSITNLATLIFSGGNAQSFDTGGATFASVTFNTTTTVTLTDVLNVTGTVTVNGLGAVVDFDANDTAFNQSTGQNFTITNGTVNVGTGQFICGTLSAAAGTSFTQTGDNGANVQSAENITGAGAISWDNTSLGGTLVLGESTASAVHYHKKNISITTTPITLSGTFYDLTVPASHILNLGNNITVTNTLTNNGSIVIADYELSFLNYTEGAASAVSIADGIITSTKEAGPSQGFSRVTFTSGSTATINGDTGGLTIIDSPYNGTALITTGTVSLPAGTIASLNVQTGTATADGLTINGNVDVTGTLNLTGDTAIAGNLTVTGTFESTSGILSLGSDLSLPTTASSFDANGGTIRFTGTGTQTINPGLNGAGTPNAFNVIDENKASGSIVISGPMNINSLSYTDAGSQTLQIDGAVAVTGDLLLSGTDPSLLTVKGTGSISLSSSQANGNFINVTAPVSISTGFVYTAVNSSPAGLSNGWNILAGSLEYVWKGGTLTDSIYSWDEAANWETGIVPATDGSVTARIPDLTPVIDRYPTLVTDINLSSLIIEANASLTCEGKEITITTLNNSGTIRLNSSEPLDITNITNITNNAFIEYYGSGDVNPNWKEAYTNMRVAAGTNLQLGATSISLSGTLTNLGSLEINGAGTINRSYSGDGTFIYSSTSLTNIPPLNGYNNLTVSDGTWTSTAVSVGGDLEVSGDAEFTSTASLTVTGLVTVSGTAVFTSDDTLDVTGSLTVSDNAVFTSNNTLTAGATTIEDAANASFNAATLGQTTELDSLVLTTTGNISTGNDAGDSFEVKSGDIIFPAGSGSVSTGGTITASGSAVNIQIAKDITLTALTTFSQPVALTATANITLTGNAVFLNTLTGDATHGLHITGTARFNDAVTDITTLEITGTTTINTATITTTGAQTYTGNVTLGANTILEGSSLSFGAAVIGASHELEINGDADFTGAVSGITTFTINGNADFTSTVGSITALTVNGNAEFNGALTNIGTFYVDGDADINTTINTTTSIEVTGTTDINTSGITTTGTQTYTGDVTLIADTTLTAGSAQDIEMGSDLTGIGTDRTLTISGGNFVLSKATVPVITSLPTLIFSGGNAQSFDPGGAEFVNVTFNTTNTITLTDDFSATGTVTVNGAGAAVDFETNNTGFSQSNGQNFIITNGTVLVGTGEFICGTLNAAAGTSFTQTGDNGVNIQSAENIIGAGTINWDNGDAGGTLALGASSASAVNYHHKHVTIAATSITLSGTFYDLTVPALYTLNLGNNLTVTNTLTNNGTIAIGNSNYVLSFLNYPEDSGSSVSVGNGTITSANTTTLQTVRNITFNGISSTINGGAGLTLDVADYGSTGLVTTGTVSLPTGSIASLDVQSGTTNADALTVNTNVDVDAAGALSLTGNCTVTGNLTVTGSLTSTTGVLSLDGNLSLPVTASSFDANGGTIRFTGTGDQTVNPGLNGAGTPNAFSTINIAKTGGSISFNTNPLTVTTLSQTTADTFAITFNENLSVTNAVTFSTSGTVTLGDADTDVFTFDGGVTHTAGNTTLSGTLQTSDDAIALQNISLGSASAITTGNGIIQINGNITGGGYNLALISGSGATTVSGNAIGLGDVTLQNAAAAGAVSFNGNFEAAALITFAGPHNISLTGNTTTVTNAVTFDNTGLLTLGNAASDTITFTGGVTHTAGDTTLSGTLRTSDDAITLDNLTLGTNSVIRSLDAAAGAAIAINGNITGAGNNLTLVSGSGTTTVSGDAAGLGIVTLQSDVAGATGTVGFEGGFTATSITTYGRVYDISFTGNSTQVTNAVTFINTGALILGDAYTDEFIFNGGVTHTAGGTTLSGRLQTSDDAVTLQNLTMGTDSEIDSGTAIISIQGSTTGTSHNLTITGDVDFTGAVSGITTFNITGNADFASTVGTVTALTVTGNAEFNGAVTNIGTLEVNGNAVINNTITSTGSIEVTGNTTINTTTITTTGTQTYTGNVTLVTDVTLTTDNLTAQNISMGNDLNGGNNSLIISGGNFALTKVTAPVIANLPTLRFTGANTQSFDPGGAAFNNIIFETANPINITSAFDAAGNITVNNSALILTFTDTAAFEQTDTDALFTITSGTVNVGTGQFICGTLSAALGTSFTQTGNNGLNEQSAEWITNGDGAINWDNGTNGGTLSLGRCESGNIDFHNKEVTITAVTITLSGTFFDLIVPNPCTLTLGNDLTVRRNLFNYGSIVITEHELRFLNYIEDIDSIVSIEDGVITSTNTAGTAQNFSRVTFTSGNEATINGNTGGLTVINPAYAGTSLVTTGIVSLPTGTGSITDLTINSGETTIASAITLSGDAAVAAGATLTLGNNLTVNGTLTNEGTIAIGNANYELSFLNYTEEASSSVTVGNGVITSTKAAGPAQNFSRVTFTNGSTATINGAGGLTVIDPAYAGTSLVTTGTVNLPTGTGSITNLTINSGETTIISAITLSADAIVAAGATLTLGDNLTVTDELINNGAIEVGGNDLTFLTYTEGETSEVSIEAGTITSTNASTTAQNFSRVTFTSGNEATINGNTGGLTVINPAYAGTSLVTTGIVSLPTGTGSITDLTINSGETTIASAITLSGDAAVAAGATLTLGNNLTVNGTLTNEGTIAIGNANYELSFLNYTEEASSSVTVGNGVITSTKAAGPAQNFSRVTFTNGSTATINGAGGLEIGVDNYNATSIITTGIVTIPGGTITNLEVQSDTTTVSGDLTLNGNLTASGVIDSTGSLTVTGLTKINTTNITTTGTQTYGDGTGTDTVTLGEEAVLTGTTVTFNTAVIGVGHDLTVGGNAEFNGAVTGVYVLQVNGTTAINTTTITTTGTQTYGDGTGTDTVTLGEEAVLTGTTVTFNTAVIGVGHDLTVGGNAEFNDAVTEVDVLQVNGTTQINTTDITTTGTQTYGGDVTLEENTTLTGTTVTFNEDIDGNGASNVTAYDLSITGNAVFGDGTGPDTINGVAALEVSINAIFNSSVNTASSIFVTGTTAINTTTISTSGTQTYSSDVTLGADAVLEGTVLDFNADITGGSHSLSLIGTDITLSGICSGLGNMTVTNSGNFLLGNISGITLIEDASFTQNGTGPNQLNGSINTSGTGSVSFASDLYLARSLNIGGGSGALDCKADLFINLTPVTSTVAFTSNVQARNIALFNGIVDLAGNCTSMYALQDLILLNGNPSTMYNDTVTGITGVYAYQHEGRTIAAPHNAGNTAAPSLTVYPVIMPDETPINHGLVYASSFTTGALNGKILRAGQNFYANGIEFTGGVDSSHVTITLDKDTGNSIDAFAEAYNCPFKNVSSNYFIAAAEGCTDNDGNNNIAFSRPALMVNKTDTASFAAGSGTYTVYDDVIRLEFEDSITRLPIRIENSNNEISKAVQYISFNNGLLAFTEAFTDPDCTQTTNGQDDLSVFYIRTDGSAAQRWNTDATGISIGNVQSTDRGRTEDNPAHREILPDVQIAKLLAGVYATLRDEHKNRITHYVGNPSDPSVPSSVEGARFTAAADRCAPVLTAVYTGQELHSVHDGVNADSQQPYDAHNFIELVYSEPVDIGGLPSDALNEKASAAFSSASAGDWGGSIVNNAAGITVTGYISTENGSLVTGSRNASNTSLSLNDTLVHSLYRNFQTAPAEATVTQSHRMRISIAGWKSPDPLTVNEAEHHFWPGFIDSAESPQGIITRIANSYISDRSAAFAGGNIYDVVSTANHQLPVLTVQSSVTPDTLYSAWDVSSPIIAKYLGIEDWLEGSTRKVTEILGIDSDGDTKVDGMEMHFFDNTPLFNDTELYKWVSRRGWIGRTDNVNKQNAQDITGGSRSFINESTVTAENKTQGGIRTSSLYNSLAGFTYTNKVSLYDTSPKSFRPDVFSQDITLTVFFQASEDPVIAPGRDSLYAAFSFMPEDSTLFPLRNYYSVQYKPYAGEGTPPAFITDLAGNRMKEQDVETIDRTPPVFSITVGPVGSKEVYVVFSKQLLTTAEALSIIPQELELTDTNGNVIAASINQVDSSIPASVKHDTETGTALIISLINPIRFEDVLNWRLRVKRETWAMDEFTGQYDYIPRIFDSKIEKNSMIAHHAHTLSDFAVNALNVLYAFDSKDAVLGQGAYAEGEWAVRDFTGTSGNSGRIYTQKDITIASRITGLEGEAIPSEKVILYADIAPNPESLAKTYNENTGNSWSIWLPTLFTAFSPEANTTAKPLQEQRDASNAELRNFILPNDPANPECFGWGDGSVVQMMFAYDVLIDHDADEETPPQPLYMFRLSDPSNISSLALWQFRLSDIQRQRGGVTILNNVINVTNRETVVVEVDIKRAGNLTVHVMTLDGNIVKTLQRGRLSEGLYYYKWDGTNIGGNPVARGMYFIRVVGPDIDETRKVMTIK